MVALLSLVVEVVTTAVVKIDGEGPEGFLVLPSVLTAEMNRSFELS